MPVSYTHLGARLKYIKQPKSGVSAARNTAIRNSSAKLLAIPVSYTHLPLYQGLGLGLLLATCACIVANCFGDRWTYLEITGLLWVLVGTAIRATQLAEAESPTAPPATNPCLLYTSRCV